jgi:hypothetical protein
VTTLLGRDAVQSVPSAAGPLSRFLAWSTLPFLLRSDAMRVSETAVDSYRVVRRCKGLFLCDSRTLKAIVPDVSQPLHAALFIYLSIVM